MSPNGKRLFQINAANVFFYISDILIIWPHSKEEFWNVFEILNQDDDNIKLKATISDKSEVVSVTVYKGTHKTEYQIRTDLNCDPVHLVYLITCNFCKKNPPK